MALNTILIGFGSICAAAILLLIGGGVALKFSVWAFGATIRMSFHLIGVISTGMIKAIIFIGALIGRLIREAAQYGFELASTAFLEAVTPPVKKLRAEMDDRRNKMRGTRAVLMSAIANPLIEDATPKDIRAVPAMGRIEPTLNLAKTMPNEAEYHRAFALLGLEAIPEFTSVDLKLRYNKLLSSFSTEEAAMAQAMTEQLTAARNVIKKAHGWL